ncbi:filamentous hemagglutinin N-terminal domain-containing protein [Nostoc punctiforme]|uniref:Filamentous haemagglutinin family outer membrane protein n=1 Tax=Nostoc punctiforme (strain ATCC 29133 / PCC 73102) TaxID=63737 RepID=B2IYS3_NOSP7|nr:filamentous hemagglutinin N-terminal domain-containing protein [Nostoc punctiforme]ACC81656.1 filamentous haemagglutinin family outer membrane protein [Nostoc punctiforme PCC 73102]
MSHICWHWMKNIKVAICLALIETLVISSGERTCAQSKIVPDNTLNIESSKVINNSDGLPIENIDGGAQRGINLFHSFREFNVGEGKAVYFTNPAGIENIISRVTGSDRSEILGKLGVLGKANLFLINPNGIIFGKNAILDVKGSFVATSANAIKFGNQGFFSASSPETPLLLTIKPSALFFNQIGAGPIENNSIASAGVDGANNPVVGLRVADSQSLLLVGGNVLNTGGLNALGGRVELGGVASQGEIGLNLNNQSLTFPDEVVRGDISLREAFVNVAGDSGGAIALHGKNIDISEGSSLNAGIAAGLGTPTTTVGDISLNATQAISISQSSSVTNQVSPNATGNSSNINIQAGSLNLTGGSQLSSRTLGQGNSGNILVDVSGAITVDGEDSSTSPSRIINQVQPSGVGNSGDINLKSESLKITQGGYLSASTLGRGNSGDIFVDVSDAVTLDGENSSTSPSRIMSLVAPSAIGDGGDINLKARSLILTQGGTVTASTLGKGNSRNIFVDVKGAISLDGVNSNGIPSLIANQVQSSAVGNGGDINIKADSLTLTRGGLISGSTLGRGNSGNIFVDVKGSVTLDGKDSFRFVSGIRSAVSPSAIGNSGDINIKAESLSLTQGGFVDTGTFGEGNSGNISVDVGSAVTLDGVVSNSENYPSRISSQILPSAVGNGGDINIKAESLSIIHGGTLNTAIFGEGNAGNISVDVKGAVILDGVDSGGFGGTITSQVTSSAIGDGGDINIKAESLTLKQGVSLSATTFGEGNSGNISVDVKGAVILDGVDSDGVGSAIFSEVESSAVGNGGDINITAESLTLGQVNQLSSSTSGRGNAGNISVDAKGAVILDGVDSNGFGSAIFSQVESSAIGDGGDINVKANSLNLTRGGSLNARTLGNGNAGNVSVDVRGAVRVDGEDSNGFGTGITTEAESSAIGNGGDINIKADSLALAQGGIMSASTFGQGNGGNIQIDLMMPNSKLTLSDKAAIAASTSEQGKGGNIEIEAFDSVNLTNDSEISVNSKGQGNAGDLRITTGSLTLRRQSDLLADTVSSEGGNIQLQVRDILLLRNNSSISTTAGQEGAGGNGGNIDINTKFLVAVPKENSDITANAFEGKGGLIKITTQGIFGIEKRENLTPLSDITAFSQQNPLLDGEIVINIQNADIRKELVALPTNLVDVSGLISQGCAASRVSTNQPESQFIVTGRGGLPPQPGEALRVPAIAVDENPINTAKQNQSPDVASTPPLEANSWRFDGQGRVILTASATSEASSFGIKPGICHGN